jgi:spermidine synthase
LDELAKVKTITQKQRRISVVRKLVLPLFLVSGTAGLIYEVAWARALGVVFGNTIYAASTVLTTFMLGLALGSWFFGRLADRCVRPLRLFALLELLIGIYAIAFPTIMAATDIFYLWFFRSFHPGFYPLSLIRFVLSVLILLFPTVVMGGTLPVLTRLWAKKESEEGISDAHAGRSVGLLYSVNTFGAVAGSFLAGYVLIRILGVSNTIYVAAAVNIFVGISSFILSGYIGKPQAMKQKYSAHKSERKKDKAEQQPGKKRPVVLVAVGLAGFCALALEILWMRVLVFVLGTSVYAFACMLTCYIFGIALGSFICSRLILARIKKPVLTLGIVQFLIGLSVLLSIELLEIIGRVDYMLLDRLQVSGFWEEVAVHFIDAALVLLLPTVLMGAVFPIAVEICTRSWKTVGKRVGEVYASNTIGCTIGSFMAGFVMVPFFGMRDSFLIIITIQLFVAVTIILFSEKRRKVLGVAAMVVSLVVITCSVLLIPSDVFLQTINTYHHPSEIIYMKDDVTGTITVHDLPDGNRLISVDGVDVAGMDLMLRTTQKLQAYAPLIVHGNPKKVLQIGFGSGETSGIGLAFGVEQYSIVEICPGIFEAGRFFEEINRGSYKDPQLRKIIMDGKNFVKMTYEKFDVIMNDSTYPGTTGSSALYTYDHFKQCREHLEPDGVLSCWVPLDLRPADFSIIVRSFQAVMPYSSLWMVNNCLNKHAVLMGTMKPMRIDFKQFKSYVDRQDINADLSEINIQSVYEFLDCFVVGQEGLRNLGAAGPLNTDDTPFLEFGAAIKRDIEGCWIDILQGMSRNHSAISQYVHNMGQTEQETQQVQATLERYFRGTNYALRGMVAILKGDFETMNSQFDAALKMNPDDRDVQSCLNELKDEVKPLLEAVQRSPEEAMLRSRLAKRYLLLRDYEHAAEHYSYFVKLESSSAAGWNNLGVCYNNLEQYTKAVRSLENAVNCNPQLLSAYFNLSYAYENSGNLTAAIQILQDAVQISSASPDRIRLFDNIARLYVTQKKYSDAIKMIEEAIKLAPGNIEIRKYFQNRKENIIRATKGTQQSGPNQVQP